jgi:hypothetical protein
MKKKLLLHLLLLFAVQFISAQAPTYLSYDWAGSAGGVNIDFVNSIAVDAQGNSYITGYLSGTATFGTITLTSTGTKDFFVAKLNAQGQYLWVSKATVTNVGQDESIYVSVDPSGNCYITGNYMVSATFGSTTLTTFNAYTTNAFVAKLDAQGGFVWATQAIGGDSNWTVPRSIVTDAQGNTFLTGIFRNGYTVSFGSTSLSGSSDGFITKLNTSGQFLWAKKMTKVGMANSFAMDVSLDATGNVYAVGNFINTAVFGSYSLTTTAYPSTFTTKLNTDGDFLWAVKAGGISETNGNGIVQDASGNSYIVGEFVNTTTFGTLSLTSGGQKDIYIAKLNAQGQYVWAIKVGGTGYDYGITIKKDSTGGIYVSGIVSSGLTTFGTIAFTSPQYNQAFIAKLNAEGVFSWVKLIDETNVKEMAIDTEGKAHITGILGGPSDFGTVTLTQLGNGDIYVAKTSDTNLERSENLYSNLSVYPNPSSGVFTLSTNTIEEKEIQLYAISGQLVLHKTTSDSSIAIDLSNQPKGVYFINLIGQNSNQTFKVIVK